MLMLVSRPLPLSQSHRELSHSPAPMPTLHTRTPEKMPKRSTTSLRVQYSR